MLCKLMHAYRFEELLSHSTPVLFLCLREFEAELKRVLPRLAAHFVRTLFTLTLMK